MPAGSSDLATMSEVLRKIFQKSTSLWRAGNTLEGDRVDKTVLDDYDKLLYSKPQVAEGKLESVIRNKRRLLLNSPFYLPPLKDDTEFIPILSIDWRPLKRWVDIRIGVEMHRFIQIYPDGSRSHLRSLGFRFEISQPGKRHDYMHVQVTNLGCPDWLPTTIPCIPIVAECPISLLFCVLVSLYGQEMHSLFGFSDINMPRRYIEPLKGILRQM